MILAVCNGNLKNIIRLGEGICNEENIYQLRFYTEILCLGIEILANFSFEFHQLMKDELQDHTLFKNMNNFSSFILKNKNTGLIDSEISKVFVSFNWFLQCITSIDKNFPMNLSSHCFEYFLNMLN
mmetsp:Transcript_17902/g.15808  ORF Transcript_17902/g.15808 Transcript_17902/m.15808 type:complete len:126 (-) Transcript_17902:936-1313(-)